MSDAVLSLKNVGKSFSMGWLGQKKIEAVKDLDLTVNRGDIFGFLGPNGSGKTTTIRCILGLTQHNTGQIRRFGKDEFDRVHFFSRTAYCPEESCFPFYTTGRELLVHWAGMYGTERALQYERAEKALEEVGLSEAANRRIGTYSKGMKQRIGLAGCLVSDPELIIMDEPARGLDPLARHIIRNLLIRLSKEGKTIFMNSHILSEVEKVCTHAAIISEGKVRRQLQMTDLLSEKGMEVVFLAGPGGLPMPEGAVKDEGEAFRVTLKDTAELAEFSHQVAQNNGKVLSARAGRMDLEQFFIQVIEEGNK